MYLDGRDAPEVVGAALERLPVAVLIVGPHGEIARINGQVERLFGYSRAELIGQSITVLLPDGWWAQHGGPLFLHASDGPVRAVTTCHELSGRRKDGSEVPIELCLAPLKEGETPFVVASVIDITERRRIEGELWALRDERLQFETLVGELGAEFVGLRANEVDRAIQDALGQVVRLLDLDRGALFEVIERDFVHTHQWTRPGAAAPPERVSAGAQLPWHLTQVCAGELISVSTLDDVPDPVDRDNLRRLGSKSTLTIPLTIAGGTSRALTFAAVRQPRAWTPDVIARLHVVARIFGNALERKRVEEALLDTIASTTASKERLQRENAYLRHESQPLARTSALVEHSAPMRRVFDRVQQVAATDSTVLLVGERGTGKSVIAARIHELSARSTHALVRIPCAKLGGQHIDRELFERNSPADDDSPTDIGRLALADHGTIYLDEVADLPLGAQASLLRFLQEDVDSDGVAAPRAIDVRVIAATRKNLKRCIEQGTFQADLYMRLNVFRIDVPPLRVRREDIPLLVWRFVDEFSEEYARPIDTIDKHSMAALQQYAWPGNARELRTVVERAMIVATGRQLSIPLPPATARSRQTLAAIEKAHITTVLAACDWQVDGKNGAAARLGVTARALHARMVALRIPRQRP